MCVFYLTGIKHSGKSNLGKTASTLLPPSYRATFTDTDELMLSSLGDTYDSIRSFYRREGKQAFMVSECKALSRYLCTVRQGLRIVATGGGACDNLPLVSLMQETGTILYLQVAEEVLYERILRGGIPPFLEAPDPKEAFHSLFIERDARYRQFADFVLSLSDSRSVLENARILASRILQIV